MARVRASLPSPASDLASSTTTASPLSRSAIASAAPIGPPPTITTSQACSLKAGVRGLQRVKGCAWIVARSVTHQQFDAVDILRRGCGDDLAAGVGHQRIVLYAYADVPEFFRNVFGGPYVTARLDRQHHARLEREPGAIALVVARVMHIHAQPVSGAVHVEAPIVAGLDHAVGTAFAQSEVYHNLRQHLDRRNMRRFPF